MEYIAYVQGVGIGSVMAVSLTMASVSSLGVLAGGMIVLLVGIGLEIQSRNQ